MDILETRDFQRPLHEAGFQASSTKGRGAVSAERLFRELQLHVSALPRAYLYAPGGETVFLSAI